MRVALRALALALLAGASWPAAAPARGIPPGSDLQTCSEVSAPAGKLVTNGRRMDGGWQRTSLAAVGHGVGDIGNMNGTLECTDGRAPEAAPRPHPPIRAHAGPEPPPPEQLLRAATAAARGRATGKYDDESTAEGWAWWRIRRGEVADLNLVCDPDGNTTLQAYVNDPNGKKIIPPRDETEREWDHDCRKIAAQFIVDVLTDPQLREQIKHNGLHLIGARINGPLNLDNMETGVEIWFEKSRFDDNVDLKDARPGHFLSIDDTALLGDFNAFALRLESGLSLRNDLFEGRVDLSYAKVEGPIVISGSNFKRDVSTEQILGERDLLMDGAIFKGNVVLRGATIKGAILMSGSNFEESVDASSISIGQDLFANNRTVFRGDLSLITAKIGGQVAMSDSLFEKDLIANGLLVTNDLLMDDGSTFEGDVVLRDAKVTGKLSMDGSVFLGDLAASDLTVGKHLFMQNSPIYEGEVDLRAAKISGQFSLNGSTFQKGIDANGISVEQSLFMQDSATFKGRVDLIGAKVGNQVSMDHSTFEKGVNADSLSVGGHLFMRDRAKFGGDVVLRAAKIKGLIYMNGSIFDKPFDGDSLSVDGSLVMDGAIFEDDVVLHLARIGGQLSITDNARLKGWLNLGHAKVGEDVLLTGSMFNGAKLVEHNQISLDANSMSVGGHLFMRNRTVFALTLI